MAKLLSLFNYEKSKAVFLPYLIFSSSTKKNLDFLSPRLMRLSEDLFVIDLQITRSYWEKRARRENKNTQEILEEVFESYLPESEIQLFCEHPFQGLVFFLYLKGQNSTGFFNTHSLFARKIYENMEWHSWVWAARIINDCFEENKTLTKERKHFATQLRRFLSFIERTDLTEFSDLKQVHFHEIQRRFKGFLGQLWLWSFPSENEEEDLSLFSHYEKLKGFPWFQYEMSSAPQLKTWLEYPLSYWEEIKPLLIEDFKKLSQNPKLKSPYKVLTLEWNFTLYDLSHLQQSIVFKHPLCLNLERKKDFQTLIQQFSYAFDQFKENLKEENSDLDIINTPVILGWSLKVSQKVQIQERTQDFIFENSSKSQGAQELNDLNNKLQSSLESYITLDHFIPGLDFIEQSLNVKDNSDFNEKLLMPKPFYLFPKEKKLLASEISSSQFLDRTSQDWWNREQSLDSVRDCFICQLKNKELVFAFRNFQGEWFQYGF